MRKHIIILLIFLVGCTLKEWQKYNLQNSIIFLKDPVSNIDCNSKCNDTIFWKRRLPFQDNGNIRSYSEYRIETKEDGLFFVLRNKSKEYVLSDIFDYGDLDMLIYECDEKELLFLGLVDFYGSTYFIYHLHNEEISRIGDLSFSQEDDVELTGCKQAIFEVKQIDGAFHIDLLLDNKIKNRYIIDSRIKIKK